MSTLAIVFAGCLCLAAPLASAQTCKSGLILGQTWTLAESPICVDGDLNVAALTIEPGVVVEVEAGFEIRVTGTISAVGTEFLPITFKARDPASPWAGFEFQDTPGGSEFIHCLIEGSDSSAIHIFGSTEPFVMRDCTIRNNTANATGGGGILLQSTSTTPFLLERCVIQGNSTAAVRGGGVLIDLGATAVLIDCGLRDNTARDGGGIYIQNGDVTLLRCQFIGNVAVRGAGVRLISGSLVVENCAFSLHRGVGPGQASGVDVQAGTATITNSTIARNSHTGVFRNGGQLTVRNSILFNNNSNGAQFGGAVTFEYCNVQGAAPPPGPGNSNFNPIFASITGGERWAITITRFSPCVDAGDPDPAFDDCTMAINPPYGIQLPHPSPIPGRNDMGMHGGPEGCGWAPACYGDFDKSTGPGVLDIFDFLGFQNAFVASDPYACDCDTSTGIGVCDIFDFLCFQNAFVAGCP